MAQLVERLVRNEKAAGSNPTISTIYAKNSRSWLFFCINNDYAWDSNGRIGSNCHTR